jgi:phosphatidylcholine synthase
LTARVLARAEASDAPRPSALRVAAAWGVHLLTASGTVLAFLALHAVAAGRVGDAFRLLAVAMAIDCVDGTLARTVGVKRVLPWFDGTKLDDIVDYLTYVVVPVALLYEARLLPSGNAGALCASAALLASAYGFCRVDAKTADHYFRGFPSYWNVFAFYVFALGISPRAAAVWMLALAALVFAPVKFLYPSRAPYHRRSALALGAVWAVVIVVAVWLTPGAPRTLIWASLLYPAYYAGMSAWLQLTGRA